MIKDHADKKNIFPLAAKLADYSWKIHGSWSIMLTYQKRDTRIKIYQIKQSIRKLLWHFSHMNAAMVGRGWTKASAGFQWCRTHRQFHPEVPGSRVQPAGVEHEVVSPQAGSRHSIPEGPAGQRRARARPHVQGHVARACGDRDGWDMCQRAEAETHLPSHRTAGHPWSTIHVFQSMTETSSLQKMLQFFLSTGISEIMM